MRPRVLATVGLIGLLGLVLSSCSSAQHERQRQLNAARHLRRNECELTLTKPGTPGGVQWGRGPSDFPVYVHYMVNVDHPGDDPSTSNDHLDLAGLQAYLAATGDFNTVWAHHGITFVLVGVEKCRYSLIRLDPAGYTSERESLPSPTADPTLPSKIFDRYDVTPPFHGLDLYIFWNIESPASGYGSSPKFGPQGITTKGGVFLDRDCLNEPAGPNGLAACGRVFAHEVGHFFALCPQQWSTCTSVYCPDVVTTPNHVPACDAAAVDRLMADNWKGTTLIPCEIKLATQTAQHILHP
jgi:hypothetical protein